tara:strand:- start:115 stop:447 length:333 start_codon:yes stop_codon:yes gene_type:complete
MSTYNPKPFTKELSEQMKIDIDRAFDDKRTLCNVLKLAYRCSRDDSHNLTAVRSLLLEAYWMGQRMSLKLTTNKKQQCDGEYIIQDEDEDPFSVDWSNLDGRNVSKGNWD